MTGMGQARLVAIREVRERSRSRAFRVSMLVTIVVVLLLILLPSLIDTGDRTRHVGLVGPVPAALGALIERQGTAADTAVEVTTYPGVAAGQAAVRDGDLDVLVVASGSPGEASWRLDWRRRTDDRLQAVVTSAVQLATLQQRAADVGVTQRELAAVLAPVPVDNVELGSVAGRGPDDETAAMIVTIMLLLAISTYGGLVLTGVVEEKSSRVVEVLLARMPARALLAGKVAGIGLLGFAQVAVTAAIALVAAASVDAVDVPAARGAVIAWAVVWFVLGYALYATVYGALGSLASRTEDAQSVAGPVVVVLLAAYVASMAAVGRPDSGIAQFASYFPPTAPLAMPTRIAMGATQWWEPVLASGLTALTIVALVRIGGRVYSGAVLHAGPTLRLRDAWTGSGTAGAARADDAADDARERVLR